MVMFRTLLRPVHTFKTVALSAEVHRPRGENFRRGSGGGCNRISALSQAMSAGITDGISSRA